MAYTQVPAKSTGDVVTADDWNTYIRDNLMDSAPGVFDAKGDLVVGTGPEAGMRLPVGSNGQVLMADSSQDGGVKWGTNNLLTGRRGGSPTDWSVGGTNQYSPTGISYQTGAFTTGDLSGSTAYGSTINFHTAFSYPPVVLVTINTTLSGLIVKISSVGTGSCVATVSRADGTAMPSGTVTFNWLAIGPMA